MALDNEAFVFPDEEKVDVKVNSEEVEIEVDIIDDTPVKDRNRERMPKEMVEELEKDDLTEYSDGVKKQDKII